MTRWGFSVAIDPQGQVAVYDQIARAVADDIRRGRLRAGDALPGSRTLAETLRVHRNTVLAAYDTLAAEGWIVARTGAATYVADAIPAPSRRGAARPRDPARIGFELEPRAEDPDESSQLRGLLRISDGTPDPREVPAVALSRALRAALRTRAGAVLGYGDPAGDPALRSAVAQMLSEARGLAAGADDVVVTAGSQGGMDLVARALLRPGDRVAVERVGYRPAWGAFEAAGASLVPVPVDAHGLSVDALEAALAQGALRAVYVTPQHQYPTTVTLSAARRLRLLALAKQHRVALIEDDYDHEFHYDGRPVLPLASADTEGVVVYLGTLSKVLAPGLRAGWVAGPAALLREVVRLRTISGRQSDGVVQSALAALMDEGIVQRHVRRMRRLLHARRDAAVERVREVFGEMLRVSPPSGGMTLWAKVPRDVDLVGWKRAARDAGMHLRIGREFDLEGRAIPAVRLGFGQLDERAFARALKSLARCVPRAGVSVRAR